MVTAWLALPSLTRFVVVVAALLVLFAIVALALLGVISPGPDSPITNVHSHR